MTDLILEEPAAKYKIIVTVLCNICIDIDEKILLVLVYKSANATPSDI